MQTIRRLTISLGISKPEYQLISSIVFCIPDPILFHIFSYLDGKSLGTAQKACKYFYRVGGSNDLWKRLYLKEYKTVERKFNDTTKFKPLYHCLFLLLTFWIRR